MFTLSKRTVIAALIAGTTLATLISAGAAGRSIDGTIQAVNYEAKSLTVKEEASGKLYTYAFPGQPKIEINGQKKRDMSVLVPGQEVVLRLKTKPQEEPSGSKVVKGEILEINHTQGLALIRPQGGGSPRVVELPKNVAISGLNKSDASLADLKEGHLVTLKYTSL